MKIGIDARICDEGGYYGQFVWELVVFFCKANKEHDIIVYRNSQIQGKIERTESKVLATDKKGLTSGSTAKKAFHSEWFALMIFFDEHTSGYKKDYILMLEWLKEVFFPQKWWFAKRSYQNKLQKAIKKAKKIIALDGGTALELNERLNIPEYKIEKIHGFFPRAQRKSANNIPVDIVTKHNLRGKYIIYDSGNEAHNNFERILKTIYKLQEKEMFLYLIILCEETSKDLDVRSKVIEYGIADQIIFLGPVEAHIESSYYEQSSGVVFASIYESFPFQFTKALNYEAPIFANDIPAIREIMWDTISYLDPLSIHNITDTISNKVTFPLDPQYGPVRANFHAKKSASELHHIIETKY